MRARSSTRSVALVLLSVAVGLVGAGGATSSAAAASRAAIEPGQVLVTDQEAGEVLALGDEGERTVVVGDLGAARGAVVLSDGAVLVADSDAGTIVGTGGRFGDERVDVATGLEAPEALAVAGNGRLYVTSFSEGTLSRVDISSGQVAGLSAGLDGPSAVLALREPRSPNHVVVAEWFSGRVADLRRDGERVATLVRGLERPAGLATDGDGTLYVSDRAAGEIVALDADGRQRVVAEVDAPAGLSLDPVEPGPGQDYDLVAATAEGVLRIDVASGGATALDDLPSGAAVVVAPDEFVVAAATETSVADGGSDGAAGGDQVASGVDGRDLDPVMVALVAIAVFLFGVALVSGIQVWRARGDDDDADRYAGLPRKERRRARRTDKAVQAAERKTAKEVDKAEKRAAKLAPDPEPVAAAAGAASTPDRKARKEARRATKADAKAADVSAKRQATLDAHHARQEAARAKAAEKQAKSQAKADAKGGAEREKQDKADARSASKAGSKASTRTDAGADADAVPAAEPTPAPVWPGDPAFSPGLDADQPSAGAAEVGERAPEPRAPLFAAPAAAPLTAGPFLESLFVEDAPDAPGADGADGADGVDGVPAADGVAGVAAADESGAAIGDPRPASIPAPDPDPEPPPMRSSALAPVAPSAPAVVRQPSLEPANRADDEPPLDLSAEVAREVPPPKGVRGRRRAKRRFEAAEHRHRQLRAITAILSVPPPALPPAPVRRAIGVASAASVASPDATSGPASVPAALGAGPEVSSDAGGQDEASPTVPWPGEGETGDGEAGEPAVPWPNQPIR